jgi:hypothetical protein
MQKLEAKKEEQDSKDQWEKKIWEGFEDDGISKNK